MTALEEFPAELAIQSRNGRWMLVISGPDLHGTASSTDRDMVLAIAEAYGQMRRKQLAAAAAVST